MFFFVLFVAPKVLPQKKELHWIESVQGAVATWSPWESKIVRNITC